jgi:hypothetical protein
VEKKEIIPNADDTTKTIINYGMISGWSTQEKLAYPYCM